VNSHNISFFGQASALFINSASNEEPHTWFKMIKKKGDYWEKPSKNEGMTAKISLMELGSILDVLEHNEQEWKTMHKPKNGKAYSISLKWEKDQKSLWLNLGDYGKKLSQKLGEIRLLYKLLLHFFDEKIIFATHGKRPQKEEVQ